MFTHRHNLIEKLEKLVENQEKHVESLTQKFDDIKMEAQLLQISNDNKFMKHIDSLINYYMGDSFDDDDDDDDDDDEYDPEQATADEQWNKTVLAAAKEAKVEAETDLAVMETELTESQVKGSITLAGRATVEAAEEVVASAATGVERDAVFAELARKRAEVARARGARVARAAAGMVAEARAAARAAAARADALAEIQSRQAAPTETRQGITRRWRLPQVIRGIRGIRGIRAGMATRKKYRRRNKRKTKHYKKKTKRYTKKRNNYY